MFILAGFPPGGGGVPDPLPHSETKGGGLVGKENKNIFPILLIFQLKYAILSTKNELIKFVNS